MPSGNQRGRRKPQLRLAGLGIELFGSILGFTLVGLWIDRHYGTEPWALLICVVLGFIGGFYNLIRASFKAMDEASRSTRSSRQTPEPSSDDSGDAK